MVQRFEKVNTHMSINRIVRNNFIGGIAWGLGATIGVAIIFAILSVILRQINLIPYVGTFVADVVKFISESNPQLLQ